MEAYKKRIKRQNIAYLCVAALVTALGVVVAEFGEGLGIDWRHMSQTAHWFLNLCVCGPILYCLVRYGMNRKLLKDPQLLEEDSRKRQDELRIHIGERAAKRAGDLFLVAVCAMGCYLALTGGSPYLEGMYQCLVFFALLRVGCWLYYRRKY